jgi:hypothetical protein
MYSACKVLEAGASSYSGNVPESLKLWLPDGLSPVEFEKQYFSRLRGV